MGNTPIHFLTVIEFQRIDTIDAGILLSWELVDWAIIVYQTSPETDS